VPVARPQQATEEQRQDEEQGRPHHGCYKHCAHRVTPSSTPAGLSRWL
jgi:hypothetical protein